MQKRQIPKQANFTQLNFKIPPLENQLIDIPTRLTEWSCAASSKAIAMVTNYGAAGSNAAIVVKQHEASSPTPAGSDKLPCEVPVIIAANSVDSVQSYCRTLISHFRDGHIQSSADLVYNLAIKQNRDLDYTQTFSVPSQDPATLLATLESLSRQETLPKKQPRSQLPVILCFGGQNGNTSHISEELFARCELLRHHLVSLVVQSVGIKLQSTLLILHL